MAPADLSLVFSALADPTRRAILARLAQGDAPVKALVEPFGLSGPAITKHLKVLERAGLITRSREGQLRPCRLEPAALAPAADWIEAFRAMWDERLDRLDAYLKSLAPHATPPSGAAPHAASPRKPRTKPEGATHGPPKSDERDPVHPRVRRTRPRRVGRVDDP